MRNMNDLSFRRMNACLPFLVIFALLVGCRSTQIEAPVEHEAAMSEGEGVINDTTAEEEAIFEQQRAELVDQIEAQGVSDEDVLRAMRTVTRHSFVPADYLAHAYDDHAIPIGYGQTISAPGVVAWMTELLELEPGDRVLEIGTGSGYQAAVLAELGFVEVYSIEIVPELAEMADQRLEALGFTEVHTIQGDGYYGWIEAAPFDAIIVTAAPDHVPAPLVAQLAEGGRMVIPIGPPGWYQSLWKFLLEGGELRAYKMGSVAFVPFTGEGITSGGTATPPP